MAVTITLPDYSEIEEKLKKLEERLDSQNEINHSLRQSMVLEIGRSAKQFKDLQYQNDSIRKHLTKVIGLLNALSFKVNQIESPDEEEGVVTEENEGDEPNDTDKLMTKMHEFFSCMATMKDVLRKCHE
jgi:aminoglycoside/choline kinase family phosphotransferase